MAGPEEGVGEGDGVDGVEGAVREAIGVDEEEDGHVHLLPRLQHLPQPCPAISSDAPISF